MSTITSYLTRLGILISAVIVYAHLPVPLAVRALCIAMVLCGWLSAGD